MKKYTTSTSRIIICLATILILGAPTAHGKRLKAKLEFKPRTVVPLVTLRLALKCALVSPKVDKDEDGVFDVKSVVGVTIKQKNTDGDFETVASVSTSDPDDPKLHGHWDDKDTAADAHLDDYTRLLEVTVTDPTVDHTGDMLCDIVVNEGDEVETLSDQDTIGYQEPNMTTFTKELRRLKLTVEAQQQEISAQQQNISAQQQEIVLQKEKLQEAEKSITDLQIKESTKVSFSAVRDNDQDYFYEDVIWRTVLIFNKTLVNQGRGYDNSTGVFTCPVTGSYYIRYDLQVLSHSDGRTSSSVSLLRNGARVTWSYMRDNDPDGAANGVIGNGLVLQLNKGDELKLRTVWQSRFYWRYSGGYSSIFSGYLLK